MAADGIPAHRRRPAAETRIEARARRGAIEDPETVLAAAARLLESRQRTVHEVRHRLTVAGYRPDLVEGAVARLAQLGYLDDAEFARAWVASRDRAHPRGERALRVELARKGVAREIVDDVLGERGEAAAAETPAEDEPGAHASPDARAAARLLESRRAALERVEDPRRRRERAYGLLARAGFDPDAAREAVEGFVRREA